jgi:hypothetical protein
MKAYAERGAKKGWGNTEEDEEDEETEPVQRLPIKRGLKLETAPVRRVATLSVHPLFGSETCGGRAPRAPPSDLAECLVVGIDCLQFHPTHIPSHPTE